MRSAFFSACLSAVLLSLAACNNSGQGDNTNADSNKGTVDSNNTANTPPPPASTIITTPQNMLVVTHRVANYAKWKMSYDAHDSLRLASGVHSYVIGRGVKDTNMILVAVKVDDTARAMAFAKDPSLKAAMQKGGVVGAPVIKLTTTVFQDTANISTPLRSSVSFTVKDWDTWLKSFQEGSQERTDNGVMVRAYGYEANDNHKVRVVTALIDSAKAMAYFQSDSLKKRMQNAGVTGQPERFIYRVVQRY